MNLTKTYNHRNENITLILDNGVYCILGPNGVGKITLIKQMLYQKI